MSEVKAMPESDALVLAGGGIAGIAWHTGFLYGLTDTPAGAGLIDQILAADLIGTSAGSVVAAQLALGRTLGELYQIQVEGSSHELSTDVDFTAIIRALDEAGAPPRGPDALAVLGRLAKQAATPERAARRAVILDRLRGDTWPERSLRITAVDVESGQLVVFDRDSKVSMVDAVEASCAMPCVWPVVEIAGRSYLDGGLRSVANADLAAGHKRVLVLVPSGENSAFSLTDSERKALSSSQLAVIYADSASVASFGNNPLDTSVRAAAVSAGAAQGRRSADWLASWWLTEES